MNQLTQNNVRLSHQETDVTTVTSQSVTMELEKIRSGYWVLHVSGMPMPGFLQTLLATGPASVRFRFTSWLLRTVKERQHAMYYLEAQYRRAGSAGSKELTEWCKQFTSADADLLAETDLIAQSYVVAQDHFIKEQHAKSLLNLPAMGDALTAQEPLPAARDTALTAPAANSARTTEDVPATVTPDDSTHEFVEQMVASERETDRLYALIKQTTIKIALADDCEKDALLLRKAELNTLLDAANEQLQKVISGTKVMPSLPEADTLLWGQDTHDIVPLEPINTDGASKEKQKRLKPASLIERIKEISERQLALTETETPSSASSASTQLDLFMANLIDYALKDDRDTMEMPVFSLSTKPDMAVWNWVSSDGKREVEVTPSRLGRATMHDKDFIIFLISQVMADINKGGVPQRRIQVRLTDFFSATGKTVNKRATRNTGSKDTYQLAEEALDRLKSTGIKVRTINEAGGRRTDSISFIGDWSIVERSKGDGRATIIEVAVSDWMQRIVEEKTVLTISPDYFKLRKPLEKKLYEIARKHVGEKAKWKIGEVELKEKTGSRSSMKEFRRMVKDICEADNIPDYRMTPSTKVTGEAAWIFYVKDDKKLTVKISKGQ